MLFEGRTPPFKKSLRYSSARSNRSLASDSNRHNGVNKQLDCHTHRALFVQGEYLHSPSNEVKTSSASIHLSLLVLQACHWCPLRL